MTDSEWQTRFEVAIETTRQVAQNAGWPMKEPEIELCSCQYPRWTGLTDETGRITIDPTKHDPEAAAHELGHGIHESLRCQAKYSDRLHAHNENDRNGEQFAQMIRRRVENQVGRKFTVNQDAEMYEQFGDDWDRFVRWVEGDTPKAS